MVVFEYGSGSSTLWWAKRVFRVVSFEHDHAWYNKLLKLIPENVEYVYCEMTPNGDYSRGVKKYSNMFDIIVIDGRDRVNCAKNSLGALKEDGVIIWDNSERSKYAEGYAFLKDNGFKRIEFTGIGPVNSFAWSTTVFYRNKNCLAI
jgi:tRNA A58 N-methylase Trm61